MLPMLTVRTVLLALLPCLSWSFSRVSNVNVGSVNVNRIPSSCERNSPQPTALFSTAAIPNQDEEIIQSQKDVLECQGCKRVFGSRNSLFRHLRGEDETSINCPLALTTVKEEEVLTTSVIRYGYLSTLIEDGSDSGTNEVVANLIQQAFVHHMNAFLDGDENDGERTVSISALTYSTAAKSRQPSLRQDDEVAGATSEVLSFNYRLASKPMVIMKWKEYANSNQLLGHMQAWLDDKDNSPIQIQLHNMDALVPRSSKFYAERSCSQSSYRYLLPLKWILPSIDVDESDNDTKRAEAIAEVSEWIKRISPPPNSERKHHPRSRGQGPPPSFIKQLKQSLKAVESQTVPNRRSRRQAERDNEDEENSTGSSDVLSSKEVADDSPIRMAPGRFGQLWRKSRRCWSNFASPKLSGMASSPVHEAVWRTMDGAKIVGFTEVQESNGSKDPANAIQSMHAILEFRADGFVVGQLPRVISALVAMTNGWLPQNFFEIATRSDVYMPAPLAPPLLDKRLYFHSSRYHFHELTENRINNFGKTIQPGSESEQNWESELRASLLGGVSLTDRKEETDWLLELRDVVSPDIRRQMENIEKDMQSSHLSDGEEESSKELPFVDTDAPAGAYSATVGLLRSVVDGGKWPTTSDARSRVIKSSGGSSVLATKKKALVSKFPGNAGNTISSGSFTVVNDDIWDGDSLPLANELFPDLTRSVFDLEQEIIQLTERPLLAADGMEQQSTLPRSPSTHCAVNRNAQFTPHVDSGRGLGQSVSMIVGLGNYTGGETLVEGKPYDIRYNPLEFDGWNQLHWTAPFKGERYSLVFFTPEVSRKDSKNAVAEQGENNPNPDDQHAIRLAQEHSEMVPFLPPLKFRRESTDALVINELLDMEKGSAYTVNPNSNIPSGFSIKGHKCVLDVGAHVGVFSRYAIAEGCTHIIAYEPEPSNFKMLSQNLEIIPQPDAAFQPTIELHSSAVADGSSESRTLVRARNENNGKENTWRHSLEEYSQYVDRSTKMSSESQQQTLDRFSVPCVSFFGQDNGNQEGALVPGVSFVKIDCEGPEIDILLSDQASRRSSWLDTTHLVVEWSFTKERSVKVFHKAMDNLREAGFEVYYEGIGSWWDTDAGVMWPYPNDLIIFAIRNES